MSIFASSAPRPYPAMTVTTASTNTYTSEHNSGVMLLFTLEPGVNNRSVMRRHFPVLWPKLGPRNSVGEQNCNVYDIDNVDTHSTPQKCILCWHACIRKHGFYCIRNTPVSKYLAGKLHSGSSRIDMFMCKPDAFHHQT